MRLILPIVTLSAVLFACASDRDPEVVVAELKCKPNQTLVCMCGLDRGSQTCLEDQTLSECVCPDSSRPRGPETTDPYGEDDLSPPLGARCGDGTVDPGEACDDGNDIDGDGCSSKCVPDGSPESGETCPGQPVTVWKGASLAFGGTTHGYVHDHASWCDEWAMGPDRVYGLLPKADGVLTVGATLAPGFNAVISIREGSCVSADQEPLCEVTKGQPFRRVIEVKKDVPLYVFVDGAGEDGKPGAFSLDIDLR